MNLAKYYEKKLHIRTSPSIFKTATPSQKTIIEVMHTKWDAPKNIEKCNELFRKSLSLTDDRSGLDHIPQEDYGYQQEISKLQSKRLQLFRKLPADDAQKVIKRQLKELENHLRDNITSAREELRNAFGVDGDCPEWKQALALEKKEQDFFLQCMKDKRSEQIKDKNVSPQWIEYVSQTMMRDEFEPSAINFSVTDNSTGKEFASCFVPSQILVPSQRIDNNRMYFFRPGIIGLQKNQNSRLELNKNSTIITQPFKHAAFHEVTHTIKGHSNTDTYTILGIAHALKKPVALLKQKITGHQLYFKLCLAEEREADVYHATQFPEAAECGMITAYLPTAGGTLYQGSYPLLATAKTNWEALDEISNTK